MHVRASRRCAPTRAGWRRIANAVGAVLLAAAALTNGASAAGPGLDESLPYLVILADDADVDLRLRGFSRSLGIRASHAYRYAVHGFAARLNARQLAALSSDPVVSLI